MKFKLTLFLFGIHTAFSQVVNTGITANYDSLELGKVKIGGLVDTYYGYDFNEPTTSDRAYFVSSARHNEININLAYIEVQYTNERVRGRLVPGFGTYVNSNYASEKGTLKNLIEANVGVKLSKKRDIWVDAGVLGSPYTNETTISKDHIMYTRSFGSDYVPYYLTGVKLSVPVNKKVNVYGYIINGWQIINDVNNPLSVGTQLEYRPNNSLLINWDTYIGDESSKAAPENRTRYFTDIYCIYKGIKGLSLTSSAYIGVQDKKDSLGIESSYAWWQANVAVDFRIKPNYSISTRFEYFDDPASIQILPIQNSAGFRAVSGSLGFNIKIGNTALFRLEGRTFYSDSKSFIDKNNSDSFWSNLAIANLTVWF